ncbi:MAG: hypothetical protein GY910_20705, partial [bacterium]|nr:hypothetical protein [bacterium]
DELIAELRKGGLFIVFRHAKKEGTEAAESEWERVRQCSSMDDLDRKRRLSAEGVDQSAMIGRAMREARVPIGEVLTSRYCRAIETGLVAFGRAIEMKELDLDFVLSGGSPEILEFLASRTVEPTTNIVVVTHKQRLSWELGIREPKQGEAFVFDLECPKGKRLLGRIPDSGW